MKDILKQIKEFEKKNDVKIIYLTLSGSKLYGTDNENSDTDIKGIFVPSMKSILLKKDKNVYVSNTNATKEKNTSEDVDLTIHNIYDFFNHLKKSETGAIDILFSMWREDTQVYCDNEYVSKIKENYKYFLNKNMKSFVGYSLSQAKKFGIKGARYNELDTFVKSLETIGNSNEKLGNYFEELKKEIQEKNFKYIKFVMAPGPRGVGDYRDIEYISVLGKLFHGDVKVDYFVDKIKTLYNQFGNRTKTISNTQSKTDWKALSHSYRIATEVEELLENNFIKFPLKEAELIKNIKYGKIKEDKVVEMVKDKIERVDELLLKTTLQENSDENKIEELLLSFIMLSVRPRPSRAG